MKHKRFAVSEIKALADADEPGTFEALVSIFGNVDRQMEIVAAGAFKDSLSEGLPAIVWSHDWLTPPIGVCLEARETDEGLLVKARLFVADDEDHDLARKVHAAMRSKGGDGRSPLREFSIGYRVLTERYEDRDGQQVVVLEKLDLIECGPCLRGANTETRLVGVKALDDDDETPAPKPVPDPPSGGPTPEQRTAMAAMSLPDHSTPAWEEN